MLIFHQSSFSIPVTKVAVLELDLENVNFTSRGVETANYDNCISADELSNFFLLVQDKINSV